MYNGTNNHNELLSIWERAQYEFNRECGYSDIPQPTEENGLARDMYQVRLLSYLGIKKVYRRVVFHDFELEQRIQSDIVLCRNIAQCEGGLNYNRYLHRLLLVRQYNYPVVYNSQYVSIKGYAEHNIPTTPACTDRRMLRLKQIRDTFSCD